MHVPYLPLEVMVVVAALSFANTSVGTLVLAVLVAAGQWWQNRKIREVHVIVNSQKAAMQKEIDALRTQLALAVVAPAEGNLDA
jgi:hypothetical protein